MEKERKATPLCKDDWPCLSDEAIAAARYILSTGNRVELVPDKYNGVRVFELRRREVAKQVDSGGRTVV